jgi:hypothetical protein
MICFFDCDSEIEGNVDVDDVLKHIKKSAIIPPGSYR